jgi:hypothetical protein
MKIIFEKLILATGSNPKIWEMLQSCIMPSLILSPLFTFNKDARIKELPGVAALRN